MGSIAMGKTVGGTNFRDQPNGINIASMTLLYYSCDRNCFYETLFPTGTTLLHCIGQKMGTGHKLNGKQMECYSGMCHTPNQRKEKR